MFNGIQHAHKSCFFLNDKTNLSFLKAKIQFNIFLFINSLILEERGLDNQEFSHMRQVKSNH
jgi:hypothetical protein